MHTQDGLEQSDPLGIKLWRRRLFAIRRGRVKFDKTILRSLIASQQKLSARFDAFLPARFTIDGNEDLFRIGGALLGSDMAVWDIGGGNTLS